MKSRPNNEQAVSKVLHPIYQALDSRNYSKALKLTSANAIGPHASQWDIVIALRVHALERCGKRRESLLLLWRLLNNETKSAETTTNSGSSKQSAPEKSSSGRRPWRELRRRIESLTEAGDAVMAGEEFLSDPARRLDERALGGAGQGEEEEQMAAPVADETVLSTLAVTLRLEGLSETLSQLYFLAVEAAPDQTLVLEEAVCVHLQAACDVERSSPTALPTGTPTGTPLGTPTHVPTDLPTDAQPGKSTEALLRQYHQTRLLVKHYERMQTASLQLSKLTSQPLHFQWTAFAALLHLGACQSHRPFLLHFSNLLNNGHHTPEYKASLERQLGCTCDQLATQIIKFNQKIALLPRLAESLSSRIVLSNSNNNNHNNNNNNKNENNSTIVVSENDWDVYLETLLVQSKHQEALHALHKIPCSPMNVIHHPNTNPTQNTNHIILPQINDEHTIETHLGSLLPYTKRKQLERRAQLALQIKSHSEARSCYNELLKGFPDQWTYWLGLLEAYNNHDDDPNNHNDNHDGWKHCYEMAKKSSAQNDRLRGPHLCLVELAALRIRRWMNSNITLDGNNINNQSTAKENTAEQSFVKDGTQHTRLFNISNAIKDISSLRQAICSYGNHFAPMASCCHSDLNCYLKLFIQSVHFLRSYNNASDSLPNVDATDISSDELSGIISDALSDTSPPKEILLLLQWCHQLWKESQSSSSSPISPLDNDDSQQLHERRRQLRVFVFAIQTLHLIIKECRAIYQQEQQQQQQPKQPIWHARLSSSFLPPISQMIDEWRSALSFPVGAQKEVLPGDELALLISQRLQHDNASNTTIDNSKDANESRLVAAASLLEEAITHSPHNPHLKIALISIYSRLRAAHRALVHYEALSIKQIQLDSCSYLILPALVQCGLYAPAVRLSSSVLRLHGSTNRDVKDYCVKAFRNGLFFKSQEMTSFQRGRMNNSLQLLYCKGLIMDCAALLRPEDMNGPSLSSLFVVRPSAVDLGAVRGLCGGDDDVSRAHQIVSDAEVSFNAPSIMHAAAVGGEWSDNRDTTVNYFESLTTKVSFPSKEEWEEESLMKGHLHGLLVRSVLLVEVAKAPKKGKPAKNNQEIIYRCNSLKMALERIQPQSKTSDSNVAMPLWHASCQLCHTLINTIHGSPGDTMAMRETNAVSLVDNAANLVQSSREALLCTSSAQKDNNAAGGGPLICQILPERIVPLYVMIRTTSKLFTLFGWGKRKRTKAASIALSNLASRMSLFLLDAVKFMKEFRSFPKMNVEALMNVGEHSSSLHKEYIRNVIEYVKTSRNLTKDRVDSFLIQMKDHLDTFHEIV